MEQLLEEKSPKSQKNVKTKMGAWDFCYQFGRLLVSSGYGMALILVGGFVLLSWSVFGGMSSADKKATLIELLGTPIIAITGWILGLGTLLVARYLIQFQSRSYEREIQRMRNVKNEAIEIQQRLELENASSVKRIPRS